MILNFWNANNVNISLKKSYFDLIIVSAGKNRYQQFSQTKLRSFEQKCLRTLFETRFPIFTLERIGSFT